MLTPIFTLPAGLVHAFAGSAIPDGWLECDGSAVSRTTYAALFSAISTTWGPGDGSTTFNLPDLRGRTLLGVGTGSGLTARTLGTIGGSETHTLSTSELPSHQHAVRMASDGAVVPGNLDFVLGGATTWGFHASGSAGGASPANGLTQSTGSGSAHNNMPPWAALKYVIKA